ncbi:MAG TPA: helix-turn-helix transcriptional regulator [Chloroflexota bacterium]|jgi:hypothetical protein
MQCLGTHLEAELERTDPRELTDLPDDSELEEDGYPSLYVGPALRMLRMRAGVRQSEIARHLGVDSSIPSRWEGFDSTHNGQTTRYKPVPGKYFEPLASLLRCSVGDLAPELLEQSNGTTTSCAFMATTTANGLAHGQTIATISGYMVGGAMTTTPSPVPGMPPEDLRALGMWRRWCPKCKKVFLESADVRAPYVCDVCEAPVRAHVTVTSPTSPTSPESS